jgi:anthranilate synthase component 2/para-aminobenzoate synthetase component 2
MILLIDNYDSFTYNIAQALGQLGQSLLVVRNDKLKLEDVKRLQPRAIVISPGPGRPSDSGITCKLIKTYAGQIPILGICLGHQAIGEVFGGQVTRAPQPVHGKTEEIFHDGKGIYQGLRNPFRATLYHSLHLPEQTLGSPLKVSAYTMEGKVMGVRCQEMSLEGVQFHPESIATKPGMTIFRNFLSTYAV